MTAFVHAAELGSLSAAARALKIPLASVSKGLSELEGRLGVKLLHRTTRRIALTPEGAAYLQRVRPLLAQLEEADGALLRPDAEPRGELVVSAGTVFGRLHVAPLAPQFLRAHPAIKLTLRLEDRFIDPLAEGVDVLVRTGRPPDSTVLAGRRLARINQVVCASRPYLDARGTPETPADLARHACLVHALSTPRSAWSFRGAPGSGDVRVSGPLESNSFDVLYEAALAGLGVAALPLSLAHRELASGGLVALLRGHRLSAIDVQAVYARASRVPTKVRAFVDFLAREYAGAARWRDSA